MAYVYSRPTKDKQNLPYLKYQSIKSTTQISPSDPSTFRYRETCSLSQFMPISSPSTSPSPTPCTVRDPSHP